MKGPTSALTPYLQGTCPHLTWKFSNEPPRSGRGEGAAVGQLYSTLPNTKRVNLDFFQSPLLGRNNHSVVLGKFPQQSVCCLGQIWYKEGWKTDRVMRSIKGVAFSCCYCFLRLALYPAPSGYKQRFSGCKWRFIACVVNKQQVENKH